VTSRPAVLVVFVALAVPAAGVVACRNVVVETLGDAGPADAGGSNGDEGEGEGEGECPRADTPALSIRVVAGDTSLPLCSAATVTVTDDEFSTTATLTDNEPATCRHLAAPGRPGLYVVTASAAGYTSETLDNQNVSADDCDDPLTTREVSFTLRRQ
jgi:hypothetical protein